MTKDIAEPTAEIAKVDTILLAVQKAQQEAEIKNAAIRQAERQAKYEAWSDPEAITYRTILAQKAAFESLQSLKSRGECELPTPVPPDEELPLHMRGQQPSTVRAWLRGNPNWKAKIAAHREQIEKKDKRRKELRERFPELFGIDDSEARRGWIPPAPGERRPALFTLSDTAREAVGAILAQDKPHSKTNIVSRIFAGLWKRGD